jgi:hypothetical protein
MPKANRSNNTSSGARQGSRDTAFEPAPYISRINHAGSLRKAGKIEEGNAILLAVAAERRAAGDDWAAERCERYAGVSMASIELKRLAGAAEAKIVEATRALTELTKLLKIDPVQKPARSIKIDRTLPQKRRRRTRDQLLQAKLEAARNVYSAMESSFVANIKGARAVLAQ